VLARRLAALLAGTPARLLLATWAVALTAYAAGPFTYHVVPRASTWLFVFACMAAFILGTAFGGTLRLRPAREGATESEDTLADAVATVSGIVGLFGIAAIAADKLLLSGLDYSQSVSALRNQRAEEVMAETHLALPRSPLLYVGFMTFAFGITAYLIYFLRPQALRLHTKLLAHLGLLSPAVVSWLYGGRSPLWLLVVLLVGAALARLLGGRPLLPEGSGRAVLGALVVATLTYTMYIFQDRRNQIDLRYYDEMKVQFEEAYPGTPSPAIERLVTKGVVDASYAMNAVILFYYFSHEMPVLEMTLRDGRVGPYFGQHQFYLLSAFLARVAPGLSLDTQMTRDLRAAGVYGWFSSAWGGMYMDFGALGAPVFAFLCGWLSGGTYREALRTQRLSAQLFFCYVVGGILVSPIFSMFTISISLPVLVSIVISAVLLRMVPRWRGLPRSPAAVRPV
jgi:oligosaccharide repeat unit polymerase